MSLLDLDRLDVDEFEGWAKVFEDEIAKARSEQRKQEAEARRGGR